MPKMYRSLTGSLTKYHWFEGDGMLHAVWFQNGKPTYQNKFVGTEGYKLEKEAGKSVLMGTLAAGNLLENMAVNSVLHGIGFKVRGQCVGGGLGPADRQWPLKHGCHMSSLTEYSICFEVDEYETYSWNL